MTAPPAFGAHNRDSVYRPGMMLQSLENQSEQLPDILAGAAFRRTSLCTRQVFRFTSPEMFASPCE
jgi:hypothetical protein